MEEIRCSKWYHRLLLLSIIGLIIGLVVAEDGIKLKKFEESATAEYVDAVVVENFYFGKYDRPIFSLKTRKKYYAVFSFEYTKPDGTITQNTIIPDTTGSLLPSTYKVGTKGQIVIFNQDVTTARYHSDQEKFFKYYFGTQFVLASALCMIVFGILVYSNSDKKQKQK